MLAVLSLIVVMAPLTAPAAAQAPFPTNFSDWHLPLPAGQWVVSRGPCGVGAFHHQCDYYEDHCAIDLTSAAGSMAGVPVLAPQDGVVFFMGTRVDSGLALMLQHPDGRVSALFHLNKIVVAPDQRVSQGQVVGYAGNTGSSGRPHVHFHVQPNTVERACVPLDGLDDLNLPKATATSHNLPWPALTLIDPPADLPAWLPLTASPGLTSVAPQQLVLPPLGQVRLPLAIPTARLAAASVFYAGRQLAPSMQTEAYSVFTVTLAAPRAMGDYIRLVQIRPAGSGLPRGQTTSVRLNLAVRPPADTSAGAGVVLISPTFAGPTNYSEHAAAPKLCWTEPAVAGQPPLTFRVMVAGPQLADSGWITAACWQPPALPKGTYYWKVFVRDGLLFMNRTNQRPFVFKLK